MRDEIPPDGASAAKPRSQTLKPHPWELSHRMLQHGAALLPLALASLGLGMAIYHWAAGLGWADSFLNAAMLLGGMGPVDRIEPTTGKWLAGVYALFAGLVFLVIAGAMLAPVIHHVLHRFRLESEDELREAP